MEEQETLGDVIRASRKQSGLTLKQLSKLIGYSLTSLESVEQNKTQSPAPNLLNRVAKILVLDYEELMGLAGYEAHQCDSEETKAIKGLEEFELTTDQMMRVREYARFIKYQARA